MKILNVVPDEGELIDFDFRRLTFNPHDGLVLHIGICVQRPDKKWPPDEIPPAQKPD